MKMNKKFFKFSSVVLALVLIAGLTGKFVFAATLTTIYDRLSDVQSDVASGVNHYIVFTPATAHSGAYNILKLRFLDGDDGKWCRTAGALSATTITEDTSTGLPGTLSATCTQGLGASSYDTIFVCSSGASNNWSATKYGVEILGSTGILGTTTAANNIAISVTTGTHASACGEPSTNIDSGSFALSILSDATVGVSATVDPIITFSISDLAIGFGTFSATTERFATADATGSTSAAPNGGPTVITITTNAPNGAIVSARSKGSGTGVEGNGSAGLYKSSSPTKLIAAAASSAVVTGTEGYGLYVKNVANTTGTLTIDAGFDDNASADLAISTTNQTIAAATAVVNATADVALNAAIASTTAAGSYADVVTLTGTGKF
ncbi:MAG: hypothetical protein COU42_02105 [Candidatus Nealsonbacteria bacterium CG10_big_fil_rev_8_21_14_0_10_36_24]|uniref:Uncharacterized protein n=1 Tax=Candidatus Nealsonbacteria bacterium CG10_big_fil_rev_8_21_14_0_10_36_24 TaxID=1974710 RepID=A0A2M6NRS0_9BACT|nr:MAG: hypothetical protein COU42_02105 [Candidatus Nealsonbacteria bacterium CG10_big_fil_rev_8_21_14_0_10_36_24]